MRSFAKINLLRYGEITLSFTDIGKSCTGCKFLMSKIYLLTLFGKIKIIAKNSKFTVGHMVHIKFISGQFIWAHFYYITGLKIQAVIKAVLVCFRLKLPSSTFSSTIQPNILSTEVFLMPQKVVPFTNQSEMSKAF